MIESGGNPNISDYGGLKPRYRLYFNRATKNSWWCFSMTKHPYYIHPYYINSYRLDLITEILCNEKNTQ